MKITKQQEIIKRLERHIERAAEDKKAFVAKIEKSGLAYAMSWADGQVVSQFECSIAQEVLAAYPVHGLERAVRVALSGITTSLTRNYLRGSSTSAYSNATEAEQRVAFAHLHEELSMFITWLKEDV